MQDLLGWYFSLNFLGGVAAAILARRRGHEGLDCFFISLMLTPFAAVPYALAKEELPDSPQSRGQWFTAERSPAAALRGLGKKQGQAADELRLCPHCAASITTGTKVCPSCNKAVAMDALVAQMAGKPIPGVATATGPESTSASLVTHSRSQPALSSTAAPAPAPLTAHAPAAITVDAASPQMAKAEPATPPADPDPDAPLEQKKSTLVRSWDEPGRYALNAADIPKYHLVIGEESKGPFAVGDLQRMWNMIEIDRTVLYWEEGMEDWVPLGELFDKGILSSQSSIPVSATMATPATAAGQTPATTTTAAVSPASTPAAATAEGYYLILAADATGQQLGPLSEEEILEGVSSGNIERDDLVRYPNSSEWLPIHLSGFPAKAALKKKPWSFSWSLMLIGLVLTFFTGTAAYVYTLRAADQQKLRELNDALARVSGGGNGNQQLPANGNGNAHSGTGGTSGNSKTSAPSPSTTSSAAPGSVSGTVMQDLAGFGLTEIHKSTDDAPLRSGFIYAFASLDKQGNQIQEFPSSLYLAEIKGRTMLIFGKTFNIKDSYQARRQIAGTVLAAESDGADAERIYLYSVPEKSVNPTTRWPQYNRTYVFSAKRPAVRDVALLTD